MKKLEAISNTSQKDVKQKPLKASSNQIRAVWTQSVITYSHSYPQSELLLTCWNKDKVSMMSMISLLKPLTDIPSRKAWNECQPRFPPHPRMNPKMVNSAETSGSLWSCRISPIGRWQPAVSSWLRKHMKATLAFLGKDTSVQSSANSVIHPAEEKKQRAACKLWAKINRKLSGYVPPVKQKFTQMHVLKALSFTIRGEIWLTYKIKFLWTRSGAWILAQGGLNGGERMVAVNWWSLTTAKVKEL